MKGIVSSDRTNGQSALFPIKDHYGRDTYATVTADLADVQRLAGLNNSIKYEQVSDLAAAHPLVPPAGTAYALIQAEGGSVRWRDDGAAPTATIGMILTATGELRYDGDFAALQFVRMDEEARLNVTYYGDADDA